MMNRSTLWMPALVALLWTVGANAQVSRVDVAPRSIQVDVTADTNSLVNWTATFSGGNAVSARGEFRSAGRLLGTNSTQLQFSLPRGETGRIERSQREALRISAAAAQRWWDLGVRQVTYQRSFEIIGSNAGSAFVILNLVNPRNTITPPPPVAPPSQPVPPVPPTPPVSPPTDEPAPPATPPTTPPGEPTPVPPTDNPPVSPPVTTPTPPTVPPASPRLDEPQPPIVDDAATGLAALRQFSDAELNLLRLELTFEDLSVVAFVDQGATLRARLRLNYSGAGLLRGHWLLAGPGSTVGQPMFTPWRTVNETLTRSQRTDLLSPPVPTRTPGRYYLLFCADTDITTAAQQSLALSDACPTAAISTIVGYEVFAKANTARIAAAAEPGGDILSAETQFTWAPLSGAALYQLQLVREDNPLSTVHPQGILERSSERFVGGMVLAGDAEAVTSQGAMRTTLSRALSSQLVPGELYSWRIAAFDAKGRLIGESPPEQRVFMLLDAEAPQ